MSHWELAEGKTNDYYTPKYVFDALDCGRFSMDVAAAQDPKQSFVDAEIYVSENGLQIDWLGFIWCNPPYGQRGSKGPWVEKLIRHDSGLLLMPDRTSADWWQLAAKKCKDLLFPYDKIQFISPDGTVNKQPGTGNTIFAFGEIGLESIRRAERNKLGMTMKGIATIVVVCVSPSWKTVIGSAIRRGNGPVSVKDIYDAVEMAAPDKCRKNPNWRAKVRQKLQTYYNRVDKGVYSAN